MKELSKKELSNVAPASFVLVTFGNLVTGSGVSTIMVVIRQNRNVTFELSSTYTMIAKCL